MRLKTIFAHGIRSATILALVLGTTPMALAQDAPSPDAALEKLLK